MEKGLIALSTRELERLRIISKVMERGMTQMEASAWGSQTGRYAI